MQRNLDESVLLKTKKSALEKALEERKDMFTKDKDPSHLSFIRSTTTEIEVIDLKEKRGFSELQRLVIEGGAFSAAISKESDENKVLALVNAEEIADIKNSSVFYFDFEELWNKYDSFNGITKLACTMILSGYCGLSCIIGLIVH